MLISPYTASKHSTYGQMDQHKVLMLDTFLRGKKQQHRKDFSDIDRLTGSVFF